MTRHQAGTGAGQSAEQTAAVPNLLRLLRIEPSAESVDYVMNKTQFQLHTLLTEQRHKKTWDLGERIREDTAEGLGMLIGVDEDVRNTLRKLAGRTEALDQAAAAIEEAVLSGRKVFVYGCGATGRLAKQMESSFWRPFWRRILADARLAKRLEGRLPADIADRLIGEMTGGDRALISSLEGFEDLPLIGRLQLEDHGVVRGDVVICVTEGGETSSIIGAVLAGLDPWKAAPGFAPEKSRKNLYFIYNNPDDVLRPFDRSRAVLDEPGITRINLTTGPQAITGSTRMQATTIETFVVGTVIEAAAERILRRFLSRAEMARAGFGGPVDIAARFRNFGTITAALEAALPDIATLTDLESKTYAGGRFSTYYAEEGLITVFIDGTERSPTFRLFPLDTVKEPKRKCWFQVWTAADDADGAWQSFLGRPFRGLRPEIYKKPFEDEVRDPYLRKSALDSLTRAGDEQAALYDFSLSKFNLERRAPKTGDLSVAVVLPGEEKSIEDKASNFRRFLGLSLEAGARMAVIVVTDGGGGATAERIRKSLEGAAGDARDRLHVVVLNIGRAAEGDPMGVRTQVAAKMLLNAHSTAVMAKLGKVVGNTMTSVSPSNLKLIGRATYLIQLHVNDTLSRESWVRANGRRNPISYGEANAVLFETISFVRDGLKGGAQDAEVGLSIIRILESLKRRENVPPAEALRILRDRGLSAYLN
ncbi:MAG: hypothetical protein SCM96_03225 [Acidobacteriota bacterium]|nr:hypothetical protein [Acidobacteriota bacterium]